MLLATIIKKIELANKTYRSLHICIDETSNIDIGETNKEIKNHYKKHRPGKLPDIDPEISSVHINEFFLQRTLFKPFKNVVYKTFNMRINRFYLHVK